MYLSILLNVVLHTGELHSSPPNAPVNIPTETAHPKKIYGFILVGKVMQLSETPNQMLHRSSTNMPANEFRVNSVNEKKSFETQAPWCC